jgi:hypothetical protein
VIRCHAERCDELIGDIKARLGADYFTAARHDGEPADVTFQLTTHGRSVVHYRELMFFRGAEGELVASRVRGGRAEFGEIGPDGEILWTMAPLAPAGAN